VVFLHVVLEFKSLQAASLEEFKNIIRISSVCIFKESGIAKKDFTGKHSWWQNIHVIVAATSA
jgi:hypothetical protein